ncbi:MAG: Uma2 family endonuclease [Trueperaceae bacterium]
MPLELSKRTFSIDEYHKMGDSGLFADERVELVEGEVIAMAPKGSRHAGCVTRLNRVFTTNINDSFLVRVQDPLRLSDRTELEPDIAVVHSRPDFYASAHPSAKDALLVIEVAESSLTYDRDVKMLLYARAGVQEAWLVDLTWQQIIIQSSPSDEGYEVVKNHGRGTVINPPSLPQLQLTADDVLG